MRKETKETNRNLSDLRLREKITYDMYIRPTLI